LEEEGYLSVQRQLPDKAIITLKKRSLEALAKKDPLAAAILKCGTVVDDKKQNPMEDDFYRNGGTALQKGFHTYNFGVHSFSVINCSRELGPNATPRNVYGGLKGLENQGEIELMLDTTPEGKSIHVEFQQEQKVGAIFNDDVRKEVVDRLYAHFRNQEITSANKVRQMYSIAEQIAGLTDKSLERNEERSLLFQNFVTDYFSEKGITDNATSDNAGINSNGNDNSTAISIATTNDIKISCLSYSIPKEHRPRLTSDLTILLRDTTLTARNNKPFTTKNDNAYEDDKYDGNAATTNEEQPRAISFDWREKEYTARSAAKILHGIDSPRARTRVWIGHFLWGKWSHVDFDVLYRTLLEIMEDECGATAFW